MLLGDRFALLRAGEGTVGSYLNLLAELKNDPNPQVLDQGLSGFRSIRESIATDAQVQQMNAWVRQQFGPVYTSLGPATAAEPLDQAQRRVSLLGLLGYAGDPAVNTEAKALAVRSLAGEINSDPELMRSAVDIVATKGDAAMYTRLQHLAETSTNPTVRTDALFTLPAFEEPSLVRRTLDYAVSGRVRNQDSWILLSRLLQQRETRPQTWAYIKANWTKIHAQFTTSSGNRVVSATGSFCSAADKADVQQFFASHPVEASERALRDALDSIDSCTRFRAAQQPSLTAWLQTTK